ncbi:hypothetical protein MSEN_28060 [Mycolicibacter senuensis]|uniref:PIN domain-containing protein n=1 Tax=Mycolicibacter senuensis TaxID=386913 RepID=A0A7I9XNR1_9MYCO|nr:hypothetical protein MSEN_28060 [Mycolicibacter senuensis]
MASRLGAFHRESADRGVTGGAAYDALVASAAREHGVALATRDARARSIYEAMGSPSNNSDRVSAAARTRPAPSAAMSREPR